MGGYKNRRQQDSLTKIGIATNIAVWCGNNDALEHRQNWDSRKKSYFHLSYSFSAEREEQPWGFGYTQKFMNRMDQGLNYDVQIDLSSLEHYLLFQQARKSFYASVPRWIPENPGSFIWKCPRCKRVYQLNVKILEPYLDDLMNVGQTRVSAAHLEAVQSKILRAKQAEATDNNRP